MSSYHVNLSYSIMVSYALFFGESHNQCQKQEHNMDIKSGERKVSAGLVPIPQCFNVHPMLVAEKLMILADQKPK